jgi:phosphoribosylanthranilate isomerase
MVKVKICGITSATDANAAILAGADMLGFIFFKNSKRFIHPEKVQEIINTMKRQTPFVGVFVNEKKEEVIRISELLKLDFVQLHGTETPAYCHSVSEHTPVIKAFNFQDVRDAEAVLDYSNVIPLFDSKTAEHGGSGITFDWKKLSTVIKDMKINKFVLSGGLTPENVSEAIRLLRPFAVDVSSGVEVSPGIKDSAKINMFINAVKGAI